MGLTASAKHTIYLELQEALLKYADFKARKTAYIPQKHLPYLALLEEIDAIGQYLSGVQSTGEPGEYNALLSYLSGERIPVIEKRLSAEGSKVKTIRAWFYGSPVKTGFIPEIYGKFLKLNDYCPFCDNPIRKGVTGSHYPLTGWVCPHREIEESENERDKG